VVDAPASEVYAFLAEIANLPRWQSGVERAELTSSGPVGVGSTAVVERRVLGQQVRADLRVAALEPDRRIVLETDASGLHVEASVGLEPEGADRTRVTFGMAMEATSFFMRTVEPMVASAAENDIAESLDRLSSVFAKRS
ncbi:MAG TPA: SRPBCC family protein, partial [Gemmatimonadales bacterium]|nr:SRPBCC family protein [Gemmatimonadales bacterium]